MAPMILGPAVTKCGPWRKSNDREQGGKRKEERPQEEALGQKCDGNIWERTSDTKGGREAGVGTKGSKARLPGFQA